MEFLNLHKNRVSPIGGVFATFIFAFCLFGLFQMPFLAKVLEYSNTADVTELLNNPHVDLNYVLILLWLSFVGIILGVFISQKFIHIDKFINLIVSDGKIDLKRVFYGFFIWGGLMLGTIVIDYFIVTGPDLFIYRPIDDKFILLILVSFVFLFVQTFAEELLCRGYLLQVFGFLFKKRWIPVVLSGIIFGLLHIANPEIEKFGVGIMLLHYCSVGVFLGLIVVMDNRMELAIGFHAVNNILSAILINFDGAAFKTYALFSVKEVDPYLGYVVWLISAILFYYLCAKKYNWTSIKYVFGDIDKGE